MKGTVPRYNEGNIYISPEIHVTGLLSGLLSAVSICFETADTCLGIVLVHSEFM